MKEPGPDFSEGTSYLCRDCGTAVVTPEHGDDCETAPDAGFEGTNG